PRAGTRDSEPQLAGRTADQSRRRVRRRSEHHAGGRRVGLRRRHDLPLGRAEFPSERRRDSVESRHARQRAHRLQRATLSIYVDRKFACSVSSRYFLCEFMSCSTVPSPGRGASKSRVTQPSYCLSRNTWKNAGKSTPPAPRRL